ncbi:AMP-binding protein [Variovorax sp. LjRoot84]|uniref:AMP-binding protein n=1 Tax=Variovorax sp. LjRoot84 TaxID=3342340 RepID=UPI003ECF5BDC
MRAHGWWKDKTINDCFRDAVQAFPDKVALVAHVQGAGAARRISYRELDDLAARAAGSLRSIGIGPGDVVSMQLPNVWEFVVVALAASRIGAVVNPLMPILRERELGYMLDFCEAKILIVPARYRGHDHAAMARGLVPQLSHLKRLVVVGESGADGFDTVLLGSGTPAPEASPLQPDDVTLLMFSSGTTGAPKGVMHTSNTLLSTLLTSIEDLHLTPDDVVLAASPVGHLMGYAYLTMMPLMLGATIVLMDVWEPLAALALMRSEQVSYSSAATPFLNDLVAAVEGGDPGAPSFRLFGCAGAPVPPVLIERAAKAMNLTVCSIWGMTEVVAGTLTEVERSRELSALADGRAVRGNETKVVDESGAPAAIGVTGRLLFRGSSLFVGYLKRPDLNALDAEGWFDTGDLAYVLNDEGYIRINGRSKDIIIRGGENVPVVEIEGLLLRHPAVAGAAIVGYPDERLGERACAFVVTKPGQVFEMNELTRYMASSQTAKQYWPEKVVLCDELPRTATGKVQKFRLRELAASVDGVAAVH